MTKLILSDGVRRLQERETLFANKRVQKRDCLQARNVLTDSLVAEYGSLRHEIAVVIFFDAQGRMITTETFKQGKTAECEINTRLLAEHVIKHGAAAVLFAHNHPSGDNTPSKQDLHMTANMGQWLSMIDCELLDHLVLSGEGASCIMGNWL
jgi:DNA repair protein RadC